VIRAGARVPLLACPAVEVSGTSPIRGGGGDLTRIYPNPGSKDPYARNGEVEAKNYRPDLYGITDMFLLACESNDGASEWATNVSRRGDLTTVVGNATFYHRNYVYQAGTR